MARNFDDAASDNLDTLSTPVTGAPFTLSAWIRPETAMNGAVFGLYDDGVTGGNQERFEMNIRSGGNVRFNVRDSAGISNANTSDDYSINQWNHVCAVARSATDRSIFLDGDGEGTNTTSRTPANIDSIGIGQRVNNDVPFDGDIGHCAMWDIDLTDGEVASLAAGVSPLYIRRDNLVYYCPINGQSPELDVVGRRDMVVTGAVKSEEPPIPHSIVAPQE